MQIVECRAAVLSAIDMEAIKHMCINEAKLSKARSKCDKIHTKIHIMSTSLYIWHIVLHSQDRSRKYLTIKKLNEIVIYVNKTQT